MSFTSFWLVVKCFFVLVFPQCVLCYLVFPFPTVWCCALPVWIWSVTVADYTLKTGPNI